MKYRLTESAKYKYQLTLLVSMYGLMVVGFIMQGLEWW